MAPLSRKARPQQFSWQVLDDLALCRARGAVRVSGTCGAADFG